MAGRRDDSTRDPLPAAPAGAAPLPSRRRTLHTVGLLTGLALAVAATVAVSSTDDARLLRIALLAVCWAFLVAAFLAGGRRADQLAAQAREAELRHAYEVELEREVSARARYELELEQRLRREAEEGMRRQLADLRGDLAGLGGLRGDLATLGELRADLGQLRGELAEQLSGELLIERMVMRAQAVRLPAERSADDGRVLDGAPSVAGPAGGSWEQLTTVARRADDRVDPVGARPSHTATLRLARVDGGPAAVDGLLAAAPAPGEATSAVEPVVTSPPEPAAQPVAQPIVAAVRSPEPEPEPEPEPVALPEPEPELASAVAPEPPEVVAPEPSPGPPPTVSPPAPVADRPTPRSRHRVGLEAVPDAPRRHRRAAEPHDRLPVVAPVAAAAASATAGPPDDPEPPAPIEQPAEPAATSEPGPASGAPREAPGHARLARILAESGVTPAPGRRRRRYRDEDDPQPADDVLARVLGDAPPV